jgi:DNA-binding beta-propeller fold protein YncE
MVEWTGVSVINGKTNRVAINIRAGTFPYAVSVNPSTDMVYVAMITL